MTRRFAVVWLSGLAATIGACGSPSAGPAPAPPTPVVVPAPAPPTTPSASIPAPPGPEAPRLVPEAPELAKVDVPSYESRGRRDPFSTLEVVSGPTGLTVASTRLTGIIHSGQTAMALVETSDGIGYILKPGDTLGDGRLVEVGADTAVFAVAARPGTPVNRVVLRLAAN